MVSFDYQQYVVLYEGDGHGGFLCVEVPRLALPKAEKPLTLVISHLHGPAHLVGPVCCEEVQGQVCGQQCVPFAFPAPLAEEQAYRLSPERDVDIAVDAVQEAASLHALSLFQPTYNLFRRKVAEFRVVKRVPHPDHAQQMAHDMAGEDKLDQRGVGEPAVHEQVVETDAVPYGMADHLLQLKRRPSVLASYRSAFFTRKKRENQQQTKHLPTAHLAVVHLAQPNGRYT